MTFDDLLPVIFMSLMGLSMLIYVALDGYDLGVGMLLPFASDTEKNFMMNSIGPFWDANETWLVYGVLRTADTVAPHPQSVVAGSLTMYVLLYVVLLAAYISVMRYLALKNDH